MLKGIVFKDDDYLKQICLIIEVGWMGDLSVGIQSHKVLEEEFD